MKLQKKTLLIFVVLLISVLVVISIFFSTILLSSYSALEEKYIEKDLEQAVNKLNDEFSTLSAIVSDWGPWDDTYNFVNGNDPDYIKSNLLVPGFDNLNLNIIIITNNKGEIVFSGAYDLQNKVMVPVPSFARGPLDLTHPLMNMSDPHHITAGILLLPENPMVVASQPIVHSDFSGEPQGVVIMGRYLDKAEISRLAALTQPSLAFVRTDDPALSPGLVSRIGEGVSSTPGIIQKLDRDEIAGYALIRDIYGNNALVLQITEARDIYRQGLNTTMQVLLLIILSGVFLGLVVIILLDRLLLERMNSLASQVYRIGKSGSTTEHVEIAGDDELSGLAVEINRMLDTIEQAQTKMQASEARFRGLAENLPMIIFEMDTSGSLLYVNKPGVEIFGITDEMIARGVNIRRYLSADNIEMMERGLAAVMAGGRSLGEIYTLTRTDGRLMRAIVYTSLIYREGTVTGFRGIVLDISERLKLEEALKESEEKYRALAENSADIIFSLDKTGTFTYISPQVSRYGYSPTDIVGKGLQQFIHPGDQERVQDNYQREMQDGSSISSTFRIVDKSGALYWVEENSNIKRDGQGKPTGMVGILRDVTDRVQAEEALRDNRERLENILRASPVMVFETDPVGNLLFASDLWEQLIGYPFEVMKGRHWSMVLHPEDKDRIAQEMRTLSREQGITGTEARIIRPDGSVSWVFGQSVTVYNTDGSIRGHVGTITDITERKKIEEALVESEEEYRALTENTSDVLFSINMEGIFTYISPQVNKYGYLVSEIIGKTFREIIHPEDRARVESDFAKDLEKGAQFHSTFRVLDKWGNVHWFDEEGSLRLDLYGKPIGIYGVLRDDSERKRAEEQLTESKNLYMAIFDNTGSAMIIFACDTTIILANPGWASLTGMTKEESIGRSWTEFIHPEDLEKIKRYYDDQREDPSRVPREYLFRLIDAAKNVHFCIVSIVMIPGTTNSIAAIVDISERKRAEDAIELANRKLNLMNNITRHDILNTITGLLGCVDMADATSSPEEKIALLNDIRGLTRIIQRQIAFTREYQEVGVHHPLWQNVNGVIEKVLPNFEKTCIHFEISPCNLEVYADPLLEKVFYNLVDNATRYGEKITTIRIYTQGAGNNALLIFEDDGVGIPTDQKTRVFERGVGRNTGMGLFLTQEILAITGITIKENGVPGCGARFEILIPWGAFRSVRDIRPLG